MTKTESQNDQKPYGGKSRKERIREEILAAKKKAGVQEPFFIPRGERFHSETTSRPPGAISLENEIATVTGAAVNSDHLSSLGTVPQKALAETVIRQIGEDPDRLLTRLEYDVKRLSHTASPKLLRAIGEQLNLAADLNLDDTRIASMIKVLDDPRYGQIDPDMEEKGITGGGTKRR